MIFEKIHRKDWVQANQMIILELYAGKIGGHFEIAKPCPGI
jgi:hypothetical protein